jgi:integrase
LGTASLADFANRWLQTRTNRTQRGDLQRVRDHVIPILGSKRLMDLRPEHIVGAVRQIEQKKGINEKSVRNAHVVLYELLDAAISQGLVDQACRVSAAELWPAEPLPVRQRFTDAEVTALTGDERLDADLRVYNTLAFYSGLSERELCSLRWEDWPGRAEPDPVLASSIEQWRRGGFEAVYGRPPLPDDWIVPRRSDPTQPHTEGSIYKAFRRCCVKLGIKTRSPHAIKNTFAARSAPDSAGSSGLESSGVGPTIPKP